MAGRPSVRTVGPGGHPSWSGSRRSRRGTCLSRAASGSASAIHSPGCLHQMWDSRNVLGDELAAGRLEDRGSGRARGAHWVRGVRGPDRNAAASLVVVALRHLALHGEELAALGHLHEDTLQPGGARSWSATELSAPAASCCLRHRVTLPRVGLTVKSEAARVASIASSDGGMPVVQVPPCEGRRHLSPAAAATRAAVRSCASEETRR